MSEKFYGIIPARFASSRFPGKPLADLKGKPLIQHVYENVAKANLFAVVVATDDQRIYDRVTDFGGKAVMTSPNHPSGTDRCREAAQILNISDNDVIINIQGDEPLISETEINILKSAFQNPDTQIATLARNFSDKETLLNPNAVKIVTDIFDNAIYFSRAPIPFQRDETEKTPYYLHHIGIYAYKSKILKQITDIPTSKLENYEKLEQLRWLEHGYKIRVCECNYKGIGIDTPQDLQNLLNYSF